MKKVSGTRIPTNSNRTPRTIPEQISTEGQAGTVILTNIDNKDIAAALKKIPENNEDATPSMAIPQSYIFEITPNKAEEIIYLKTNHSSIFFGTFLIDMNKFIMHWLASNPDLTKEILSLCDAYEPQDDNKNRINDTNSDNVLAKLTAKNEELFISRGKTPADKIKRKKIIAGIDTCNRLKEYCQAKIHNDIDFAAISMFLFTRSLSQFCAASSVQEGIKTKKRRVKGGETKTDREGLIFLVRHFNNIYPKATNEILWKKIKNHLTEKASFTTPCGEYEIEFQLDPANKHGSFIQTKSDNTKHSIGFSAFQKIRKSVRS